MQGDGLNASKRVLRTASTNLALQDSQANWWKRGTSGDFHRFHKSGDGDGVSIHSFVKCEGSRFLFVEIAKHTAGFLRRLGIAATVYRCRAGHIHLKIARHP